jgi:hypothetical protein
MSPTTSSSHIRSTLSKPPISRNPRFRDDDGQLEHNQTRAYTRLSMPTIGTLGTFHQLPHHGDSSFFRACEFYARVYVPAKASLCNIFNVSMMATDAMLSMAENEHYLHALTTIMLLIRSAATSDESWRVLALRHQGLAIVKLRHGLAKNLSQYPLFTTMILLAICARISGEMAAFDIHKRSIHALVKARGGLDHFGHGVVRATALQ